MKRTLVIGASEKEERYSFKAIKKLDEQGHDVKAIALKPGKIDNIVFDTRKEFYTKINTVTLYVGPKHQSEYFDYIINLQPERVIFNPGTENEAFEDRLSSAGITPLRACTLVLLSTNQY